MILGHQAQTLWVERSQEWRAMCPTNSVTLMLQSANSFIHDDQPSSLSKHDGLRRALFFTTRVRQSPVKTGEFLVDWRHQMDFGQVGALTQSDAWGVLSVPVGIAHLGGELGIVPRRIAPIVPTACLSLPWDLLHELEGLCFRNAAVAKGTRGAICPSIASFPCTAGSRFCKNTRAAVIAFAVSQPPVGLVSEGLPCRGLGAKFRVSEAGRTAGALIEFKACS